MSVCRFGLAVLCLVACAGSRENYIKVKDVKLVGNHAVPAKAIIAGLATRDPSGLLFKDYAEYDEVSVARDRERITAYYQTRGFFSAEVTGVQVNRRAQDAVDVTFTIKEGEPSHIESVDIVGMPEGIPDAKREKPWTELILVQKGDVYKQLEYEGSKENLKGYLVRHGYAYADVQGTVEVDRDKRIAAIRFRVIPGPVVKFGPTTVRGLKKVPESAIFNRIAWEEGDRYDPVKVEVTRGRVYQLGYLSTVRVEIPREGQPEVAPILIRAREGQKHEFKIGGGMALDNDNFQVRPRLGYTIKGFIDPLLTLGFDAKPGLIVAGQGSAGSLAGEVSVMLERNDFLFPRLKGMAEATAEAVDLQTYSSRGLRGRLGVTRPFFNDKVYIGFGYQFRLLDFSSVSAALTVANRQLVGLPNDSGLAGFKLDYRQGALEQSVALDLRDNPLNTKNGFYAELRVEEAGPFAGGQFSYLKLTPEVRGYWSPWSFLGFAAKIRYGTANKQNVPITERYFSGGANNHRGFTFRRLSPMSDGEDENGERVPIGGNTLFETSFETRLDLFKLLGNWFGVVFFIDGGDVTLTRSELDFGHLHWAAGVGLRYHTVVGPIRVDLGYRLNRFGPNDPDPGQRVAVHLSLGQAF